VVAIAGLVGQVSGVTPFPARAWESRTESPEVWQTWAWCRVVDGRGSEGLGHELIEGSRVQV
jgi:hypothetical protein